MSRCLVVSLLVVMILGIYTEDFIVQGDPYLVAQSKFSIEWFYEKKIRGKYRITFFYATFFSGTDSIQDSTAGSECPENQQEHICGTLCEPTCSNPQPDRKFCPRIVCTRATSGCRCVKGTVRDTNSTQCVPLDQCP